MWATVWVSVAATALTLLIAFPFAYWLARYVPKSYQKVLLFLVILPFWTSYLLRVYSWLTILGPQGAINRFLHWTGERQSPSRLPRRPAGGHPRPRVPLLPFRGADALRIARALRLESVPRGDELGATPATAVWRILLPQMKPGIITAIIFVFIPILGEYLTPQLVGGARGVMIGNLIVNFFQGAQYSAALRRRC